MMRRLSEFVIVLLCLSTGCNQQPEPQQIPLSVPEPVAPFRFDRQLLPSDWVFIADAVEQYHPIRSESQIVRHLRDASDDKKARLKEVGAKLHEIGYDRFEAWMDEHRDTPEYEAVYWFYLLLDFADALPEG